MDNIIYLDNASTRAPYKQVVEAYTETALNIWHNPANTYKISEMAKCVLDNSKLKIAQTIGCLPDEIFFTSGASEGNSWASIQREHLWISAYEHHNYTTNPNAKIVAEDYIDNIYEVGVKEKLMLEKVAYAHQLVNNESGEIFDVAPIFKKAKELGIFTICDATQSIYNIPINVYDLNCDMMIVSGHKFGSVKGSGWVFIKKDVQKDIKPLIYGTQQKSLRGGTDDVAKAYAIAVASEISNRHLSDKIVHGAVLKDIVKKKLANSGVDYIINEGEYNITSTVNFSLAQIESETLQALLSDENIFVGVGSACATGDFKVSETLVAMGVDERYTHGPIRLSFTLETTKEQVEFAMDRIIKIYKELING